MGGVRARRHGGDRRPGRRPARRAHRRGSARRCRCDGVGRRSAPVVADDVHPHRRREGTLGAPLRRVVPPDGPVPDRGRGVDRRRRRQPRPVGQLLHHDRHRRAAGRRVAVLGRRAVRAVRGDRRPRRPVAGGAHRRRGRRRVPGAPGAGEPAARLRRRARGRSSSRRATTSRLGPDIGPDAVVPTATVRRRGPHRCSPAPSAIGADTAAFSAELAAPPERPALPSIDLRRRGCSSSASPGRVRSPPARSATSASTWSRSSTR